MAGTNRGTFFSGAGLVWKWQRLVWWIFVVCLILAHFATQGMVDRAAPALDHSLASQRLFVNGFDAGLVNRLQLLPDSPLQLEGPTVVHFSVVFMIFMLFATGGILATYLFDEKPTATVFFQACGHHFWRLFRLLIYLAIVLIPIGLAASGIGAMYDHINDRSISPYPANHFAEAAAAVILLLVILVRLWFDMAQVIAVADDEKKMHRALRRAFGLLRRNFFSLLWLYVRVSIVGLALFALGLCWWMFHLKSDSIVSAFLLSQLMILTWIGTRLWQRASEALWYRNYQASEAPQPVWTPAPAPVFASASGDPIP
jgi:hypothetical protein